MRKKCAVSAKPILRMSPMEILYLTFQFLLDWFEKVREKNSPPPLVPTSSTCLSYSRADLFMIFTLVLFFAGFAISGVPVEVSCV